MMSERAQKAEKLYKKQWRERNKEHIKEYHRKWRKNNPDKLQAAQARHWEKKADEMGL